MSQFGTPLSTALVQRLIAANLTAYPSQQGAVQGGILHQDSPMVVTATSRRQGRSEQCRHLDAVARFIKRCTGLDAYLSAETLRGGTPTLRITHGYTAQDAQIARARQEYNAWATGAGLEPY